MALSRCADAKKFTQDGDLIYALFCYTATYLGQTNKFQVQVNGTELSASPSDTDMQNAADVKAQAVYSAWMAGVDLGAAAVSENIIASEGSVIP